MKIAEEFKRLNLGFDKKAWLRKHLKKKAKCSRCGSVVCRHMMFRHQEVHQSLYSSSRYFELNIITGECSWITRYRSSLANRCTSSFASGTVSMR